MEWEGSARAAVVGLVQYGTCQFLGMGCAFSHLVPLGLSPTYTPSPSALPIPRPPVLDSSFPPGGRVCHRRRTWGIHSALQNPPRPPTYTFPSIFFLLNLITSSVTTHCTLYPRFSVLLGDIAVEELSWYLHTDKRARYLPHQTPDTPPLSSGQSSFARASCSRTLQLLLTLKPLE
jgi:hypothetical protein